MDVDPMGSARWDRPHRTERSNDYQKNISDLRHGDYSYGAKCRFSLQLPFVMHSLQIIPTRNQHAFVYYFNKKYIKKTQMG